MGMAVNRSKTIKGRDLLMCDLPKPSDSPLLNTPLSEIHLSVRAMGVLKKIGAGTVGDLWNITATDFLSRENAGVVSLKEVRQRVTRFVLKGDVGTYSPRSEVGRAIVKLLPTMQDAWIARQVGCTREAVRQIRGKAGVPAPSQHQRCQPDFEHIMSQLIKMAKEGLTATQIAKKLNLSCSSHVSYIAKEHGIKLRKGETGGPGPRALDTSLLSRHLSEGGTYKSAVAVCGASYPTILHWAKKLGLQQMLNASRAGKIVDCEPY